MTTAPHPATRPRARHARRVLCLMACAVGALPHLAGAENSRPVQEGWVPRVAAALASGSAASAGAPAQRLRGPQPAGACAQIAFDVGLRHPGTTQVLVVLAPAASSTTGTLQLADLGPRGWECGTARRVRLVSNGVRPLADRRSGDGTTPAGVFPLGVMTAWDGQVFSFFGNSPDPGVTAGAYRAVRAGDCFGATPNHPDYGHLVQRARSACPGPDDEYLPAVTGAYEHAALIGANMEPDVSGDAPGEVPYASAIFLHRDSLDGAGNSRPTSGCVSLAHGDLVEVLRVMRPGVMFALGTAEWLLAHPA